RLGIDVIELGLGMRPHVLLAAAEDWGFTTATGERVPDELAPDPLLAPWLAEQRGALFANEVHVPDDLRDLVAPLFAAHQARAIVPIAGHDQLLGLIVVALAARSRAPGGRRTAARRSEGHTSGLQTPCNLVCRLPLG